MLAPRRTAVQSSADRVKTARRLDLREDLQPVGAAGPQGSANAQNPSRDAIATYCRPPTM